MTDRRKIAQPDVVLNEGKTLTDIFVEADNMTGAVKAVQRVQGQMPHDAYLARGSITGVQYEAAEAMLKDYDLWGLEQLRAQAMERLDASERDLTAMQIDAKNRVLAALAECEPIGAAIVFDICCCGMTAKDMAAKLGLRRDHIVPRLAESLETIAVFRGLTVRASKR